MNNEKKRGGAGRNQGRKSLSQDSPTVTISCAVTVPQHAKFHRMGASAWWRKMIDEAKEPG